MNSEDYDDDDFDFPINDIRIDECYLSIPEGTQTKLLEKLEVIFRTDLRSSPKTHARTSAGWWLASRRRR